MNYFARIIKHYLIIALQGAGVRLDSDTHAELNGAINDLDQHIRQMIAEQVELHIKALHKEPRVIADIYKVMLLEIVKPVTPIDTRHLHEYADRLQGSDGDSDNIGYAIGDMVHRAARFIDMSLALVKEAKQ